MTAFPELRTRHKWLADVGVLALLLGLCLFFFWQVFTPNLQNRRWFASGDFTDQFYAFRFYQAQEMWQGRLPLWNPHTFSGSPFLADIQSAVYYPFGLLTILVAGRSGLPLIAVEVEAIAHYFFASLFTYLLVKRLTSSRFAGLVSGIVYAYGSYLTSYPKLQMAILEGQTWVPLTLLAIHEAAKEERRGKKRRSSAWLSLAGLALGTTALAGHGQTLLLAAYTVLAYLLFAFFPLWRLADSQGRVGLTARLLLLPVIALGLAAAQLIPSFEYMRLSTRAQIGFLQAGGGFLFSDLIALIQPGLRVIYVGILPLILALLALILSKRRETAFWGTLALLALLLSLGRRTVLYTLLYLFVPGFSLFQGQERAMQVFSLSIAILSGYGAAVLAQPMERKTKHRYAAFYRLLLWANIAAWFWTILAYWGAVNLAQSGADQVNDLMERSVLLVLLLGFSTLILYWRLGHRLRTGHLGLLMIAVIVFDLFSLNLGTGLQRAKARDRFAISAPIQFLQGEPGPFRVWDEGLLPGNFGLVWGLEETGGVSPLRLQRYQNLLNSVPEEKVRQLLNVRYAFSRRHILADGEPVEEYTDADNDFYFYRIREPGMAAYFVYSAQVETNDQKALQRLAAADFDPRRQAILASSPGFDLPGTGQGTAHFVERLPDRLVLYVETDADGLLILSEVDYPGWQAQVDGQKTPILRADTVLRAVPVRAGSHRVEMIFRPGTVFVGLALSLLTLVAALVEALWFFKSER